MSKCFLSTVNSCLFMTTLFVLHTNRYERVNEKDRAIELDMKNKIKKKST